MQTLFLTSSFAHTAHLFKGAMGVETEGQVITFIPTAANVEAVNFYVEEDRKALEALGFVIDELDVAHADEAKIKSTLAANDCIYVSGGNTFYLLSELKKTGAFAQLQAQVAAGKLYIGASAGSVVMAPNIEYITHMDDASKAADLKDFSGLACIDDYPVPHFGDQPFVEAADAIMAAYQTRLPLCPISNVQAIVVKGDHSHIVTA